MKISNLFILVDILKFVLLYNEKINLKTTFLFILRKKGKPYEHKIRWMEWPLHGMGRPGAHS